MLSLLQKFLDRIFFKVAIYVTYNTCGGVAINAKSYKTTGFQWIVQLFITI